MPQLGELARVTTPETAVWRDCTGCGALAAMAPEADRCDRCQPPVRIQRRRVRGWRMPAEAVYVGRPTKFGNPFPAVATAASRAAAVARYRQWLASRPDLLAAARIELAGRDLACWCPLDRACHADVLLTVANSDQDPGRAA